LKPKAKASFITRLSSPPPGARDLEVRFVEPGDEPVAEDGSSQSSDETEAAKGPESPVSAPESAPGEAPAQTHP
jgi:hypothetical protein